MAVINSVPGRFMDRLVKALGITFPCSRVVIEADVNSCVKVYVVGPVDVKNYHKVCEEFEAIGVDAVLVEPDASVHIVPRDSAAGP